ETLSSLRKENPGKICPNPTDIEVQTLSGQSLAAAGEVIYKADTTTGFICRNEDQKDKYCKDYRVRFSCPPSYCGFGACWTQWFDRDDPSGTGDWETLSSLRAAYPNKICETPMYIEAVVVGTNAPASSTGEIFHTFNPTEGFVCRKTDQKDKKCLDYKVRFGCCCD
uniref:WxxW domain-containing protein n=1 Tax=Sphaeramia orbicularis TaxID=375764 RepID=A0A673CQE9_9TELE